MQLIAPPLCSAMLAARRTDEPPQTAVVVVGEGGGQKKGPQPRHLPVPWAPPNYTTLSS